MANAKHLEDILESILEKNSRLIPEESNTSDSKNLSFYNLAKEIRSDTLKVLGILNKEKNSKRGSRIFEILKKENKINNLIAQNNKLEIEYKKLKENTQSKALFSLKEVIDSQLLEINDLKSKLDDKEKKRINLKSKLVIKEKKELFLRNNEEALRFLHEKLDKLLFNLYDLNNLNLNNFKHDSIDCVEWCVMKLKEINNQ